MKQLRCTECGQVFNADEEACPNCGCPASECQETEVNTEYTQMGEGVIHDSFNEDEPYTPFSPTSWFFKDPWPLNKYPKGEFDKRHKLLGYLYAPWHLTCKNEKYREAYDILNNIFYFCNLLFKIEAYACMWSFFKSLWFTLVLVVIYLLILLIMANSTSTEEMIIALFFLNILYIVAYVVCGFILLFGIGKALHRYWGNLYETTMRIVKRICINVYKAIQSGNIKE